MAVSAVAELDNDLAQFGGAGSQLDNLASMLSGTTSQTSDFSALNQGELKNLAQPFYDRLLALGYTGRPFTSGTYPWATSTGPVTDFALANIGMLKYAFSFDVTYSTSGSSIPDWWIDKYFPGGVGYTGTGGYVAWSGSQVTFQTAYQNGWNPLNFYSGQTVHLTIARGNNQIAQVGYFVSDPLVVVVTGSDDRRIPQAPVTFTASGGSIQALDTQEPAGSIVAFTNDLGEAQTYYQLPSESGTCTITASIGSGSDEQQVTFTASSKPQTASTDSSTSGGGDSFAFAPTDVYGTLNSDGSITLTWYMRTDNETSVLIDQQVSDGTWQNIANLQPHATAWTGMPPSLGHTYRVDAVVPNSNPNGPPFTYYSLDALFPVPTTTYAPIDVSGTAAAYTISGTTTQVNCDTIALDDSNDLSFAFGTPGTAFHFPSPFTSQTYGCTYAYTWHNGQLGPETTIPAFNLVSTGSNYITWISRTPIALTGPGAYYGDEFLTYSGTYSPRTLPTMADIFNAQGTSLQSYNVPNPPFTGVVSRRNPITPITNLLAVSNNGTILGHCGPTEPLPVPYPPAYQFDFIRSPGGGQWTVFNPPWLYSKMSLASNITVHGCFAHPYALPAAVNDHGWSAWWDSGVDEIWTGAGTGFQVEAVNRDSLAINDAGEVLTPGGADGSSLWTSPDTTITWPHVTSRSVAIADLIPAVYGKFQGVQALAMSGTNNSGNFNILFNALIPGHGGGGGMFLLTLVKGGAENIIRQVLLPENVRDITYGSGPIQVNANGLLATKANLLTPKEMARTGAPAPGPLRAILLLPVSLKLLSGQTQDFDGTTPTTVIPAPENPHYASDVADAGTNILGAVPMGTGRVFGANNVYIAPNMVAAKAPPIGGLQFKWHRSLIAKSWYIRKQTSNTGLVTWDVTQRDAEAVGDDTGDGRYNNTTPSADKNEFYIWDDSGIYYGGEWDDKGPDPSKGPTFMQVGDFIHMEKAFTYKVQSSTDGITWTDAATIPVAQVITVYYQATGGTAATDWLGVPSLQAGNVMTQQSITPNITEDKVRAIVGPIGNIIIDGAANN
jgi:hypothetical protein